LERIPLVFGAIYDYEYSDVEPWVVSLKKSGYAGKVALIVYRGSQDLIDRLTAQGIHVICFMRTEKGCDCAFDLNRKGVMSIRFLHMWHFLVSDSFLNDVTHVIATDVKDVIFQGNPVDILDGDNIVVGYEGFTYAVEPWSKNNMIQSFGDEIYDMMKDEPIVCAGVIAGGRNAISSLFNQVFVITEGSKYPDRVPGGGGPDQSALNIVLASPNWKEHVKHTEKILHAGTSLAGLLSGRGAISEVIYDPRGVPHQVFDYYESKLCIDTVPHISKDKIVEATGKIDYTIVHQYDRIDNWKTVLRAKYKE
jgi:hypothetical protein